MDALIQTIHQRVTVAEPHILKFLRDIVAIPSMNSQIEAVGKRVGEEMAHLRFDQVYVDRYGSIVGRIGDGPIKLLYDAHLDTVGVGDPSLWNWDPFHGHIEDGKLYARGAVDEKGSVPGMIYGMALARDLGLLDGISLFFLGNIEEWCDGIACQAFVEWEDVRPDFVVIGEPTQLQVYRGHKGRIEVEIAAKGVSAHAANSQLGDNAIYKMLPVIEGLHQLDGRLPHDPFLGPGRVTVTRISSAGASDNAVPDECRIYVDRRIVPGETRDSIRASFEALIPPAQRDAFDIREMIYDEPSHTGAVMFYEMFFPAWLMAEDHPFIQTGQTTRRQLWGAGRPAGKWDFSTNGNYWAGKLGIPCLGFGPGDEMYAHRIDEHVPLQEVVEATKFYALLPAALRQMMAHGVI